MNLYEILGVDRNASEKEIKDAWRSQAMEHHPDRNAGSAESEERTKLINQAYEVLSNPQERAKYDAEISVDRRVSRWMIPTDLRVGFPIDLALAFLGGKQRFSYLRTVLYNDAPVITMSNIVVDIPRRCQPGSIIKVLQGGNISRAGENKIVGDLYLMVNFPMGNDEVSVDRNGNLYGSLQLPWICGLRRDKILYAPFPDGAVSGVMSETFPLQLDPQLGQDHIYAIPGQGFLPSSSIFVKVLYDFPTNMSAEDQEVIIQTLNKYANPTKR